MFTVQYILIKMLSANIHWN